MSNVVDIASRRRQPAEPEIPQHTIDVLMEALDRNRLRAIVENGMDPASVFEAAGPFSPNASTTLRCWPERYFR
jgi:hypothetical protein